MTKLKNKRQSKIVEFCSQNLGVLRWQCEKKNNIDSEIEIGKSEDELYESWN